MQTYQQTVCREASCTGVGLHSGKEARLTVVPAPPNHGIRFMRTDLPNRPVISALFRNVVDTSLATVIGENGVIVSTIEHLMACFAGMGIDNALVEIDSYEVPIMDGSAGPFTAMVREAGIEKQATDRLYFTLKEDIGLSQNGRSVLIQPSDTFRITCTIDFVHPLIGKQSFSLDVNDELFEREISRARTFGFLGELSYMKQYGFAKGGSLENAIVLDDESIVNEGGLRFPDEYVRHKILDCLGDFSLLGIPILGHVITHKSGHAFNHAFLEQFFAEKSRWETASARAVSQKDF